MKYIPTTATAADKLRRRANDQRKKTGESLAAALDDMARASGYESWKHATCCVEQTPASREALGPLPDVLVEFLEATATATPPSEASKQAFAGGLAFALDVKDIEGGLDDDIVFCDDAWPIAGADRRGPCDAAGEPGPRSPVPQARCLSRLTGGHTCHLSGCA